MYTSFSSVVTTVEFKSSKFIDAVAYNNTSVVTTVEFKYCLPAQLEN